MSVRTSPISSRFRWNSLRWLAGSWGIFLAVVLPWEIRNHVLFGSFANEAKYRFFFAKSYYDIWAYTPKSTLGEYLHLGLGQLLVAKLTSFYYKLDTFAQVTSWPLMVFLIPGFLALRKRWIVPVVFYFVITYLVMGFLNSIGQQAGWNGAYVFLPFWIPIVLVGIQSVTEQVFRSRRAAAYGATALATLLILYQLGDNAKVYHHRDKPPLDNLENTMIQVGQSMRQVSGRVPPIVMTHFDFHLTYYTGLRTVKIPTNDPESAIFEIARRYRCTHLVLVGNTAPSLQDLYAGRVSYAWLQHVKTIAFPVQLEAGGDRIVIYRIRSSQTP